MKKVIVRLKVSIADPKSDPKKLEEQKTSNLVANYIEHDDKHVLVWNRNFQTGDKELIGFFDKDVVEACLLSEKKENIEVK